MTKARRITVFNEVLTLPAGQIILLLFFLTPTVLPEVQAQTTTSVSDQLTSATIYFVTPTAQNKVKALREELAGLSEGTQKDRIERMIKTEQMQADSFRRALISAVDRHFSVAKYEFIADTSIRLLLKNPEQTAEPFFLVRRGKTESGVDALILYDNQMNTLSRPIPYYARLSGFTSFVDALFGKTEYNWNDLDKVIRKWSDRMEEFCQR